MGLRDIPKRSYIHSPSLGAAMKWPEWAWAVLVSVRLLACMKGATSETDVKGVATKVWMADLLPVTISVTFITEDSWTQYCGDMDISMAMPTGRWWHMGIRSTHGRSPRPQLSMVSLSCVALCETFLYSVPGYFCQLDSSGSHPGRGNLTWGIPSHRLTCERVYGVIFLINDWRWTSQSTAGSASLGRRAWVM